MSSSFITRIEPEKDEPYTVIFTTDDHDKYRHIENECRKMIGHAKPTTNADKYFRNATDEEIVEAWYYAYNNVIFDSTNSRQGLLEWLKQEVESDES